jgi:hypothetical protein
VCEIADFRVQAMSSFRVHAIVVQAMYSHQKNRVCFMEDSLNKFI